MSETNEGSIISGRSSSAGPHQAGQEWGEGPLLVIEPTKELAPMDAQQELLYWKGQWRISMNGVVVGTQEGTPGDEFFDRKCRRLGSSRKQDESLPIGAYLLPRYPMNEFDKSLRMGKQYDPTIQLTRKNLIGTLALDPKREVAWMTVRNKINNTSSAWENAAGEGRAMDAEYILDQLSSFQLQTKNQKGEPDYVKIGDVLRPVLNNEPCELDILRHRVTSAGTEFAEEVVMWMHVIGRIILPYLRSIRQAWETNDLESVFRLLYQNMGTEYMKDLSHIGAMAQYGDEMNADEMGVEPIHTSDFGNKLYAAVITEGHLPKYDDWTVTFSPEHKGDVIESIMGLNFLEKEERLDCSSLGITQLEDAAETMIKTEWWAFMKGLTWSLEVLQDAPVISAICAVREACTNWVWTSTEKGGALDSLNGRMCLACGKRKNKTHEHGCYPRLIQGLIGHLHQGTMSCVHDFLVGTEFMKFQNFTNIQEVIERWWTSKKRAFVVYVSENGHRQWPVGGYWDLEILTCSMQNIFKDFLPRLLRHMQDGNVKIRPTTQPHREDYPVIPNHLTALLDPQIPRWEGCDFPINSSTDLVETWRAIERFVDNQSKEFPQAVQNANHRDYSMLGVQRELQKGLSGRIHKMYAHVNYGRGIPVVIASCSLNSSVTTLLGSRIKVMETAECNRHNMSELQLLADQDLTDKLQQHVEFTAKFLGKVEEAEKGVSGSRVGTSQSPPVPAVVQAIVHQTEKQVEITITPGPVWKTTEFEESDVWLVGDEESMKKNLSATNMTVETDVPPLNLTDNTWTPTKRVRGIVKQNPMKGGVSGSRVGTPEFYMDYLQAEGIASKSSIRYPTQAWFKDHFILPEDHGFSQVELLALEKEGVRLLEKTVTTVDGLWILNSHATKVNERIVRRVRLLEVGAEGAVRRANQLRKEKPSRFSDKRWNGSPTCLHIDTEEFLEKFLYTEWEGFRGMTENQIEDRRVGDVCPCESPWRDSDRTAAGKHCGPCGGTYGLLYPCMLCTNWTHNACAYSAEGGLICASHVAVLDCSEGLMVVISDPGRRMNGTILRPTKKLQHIDTLNTRRRRGSVLGPPPSRAAHWEQLAMFKSIWLAAGLKYKKGAEITNVKSEENQRGLVERIHPYGTYSGLGISALQRHYRAVPVEALASFVDFQNEQIDRQWARITRIDELDKTERKMLRYNHLAHRVWREQKSASSEIFKRLDDVDPMEAQDLYAPRLLETFQRLDFPEDMTRSPFLELTNACPEDQALAYQSAVMKELAKKAYLFDHNCTPPKSTLLAGVVIPETEPYQCGAGWPFQEVKVAKATTAQYHQAGIKTRCLRIARDDTSSGSRVGEGVMADVSAATLLQ
eukprot:5261080-Amphidinium_carterae.1